MFSDNISRLVLSVSFMVAFGVFILPAAGLHAQQTWYVDDNSPYDPGPGNPDISDPLEDGSVERPYDAIQEGISASTHGDTVLVAEGTYTGNGNRQISFQGKAITVKSENGPEVCIIDAQDNGSVFVFDQNEIRASVLSGFTITGGGSDFAGGGIYGSDASPTITNNVITQNTALHFGGGISFSSDSSPLITNNIISSNSCGDYNGGGIYCDAGHEITQPVITNNVISYNSTTGSGGGIMTAASTDSSCSAIIRNNIIEYNQASYDGGGIVCLKSNTVDGFVEITNCTVAHNDAGRYGGGIALANGVATVTYTIVWDNSAPTGEQMAATQHPYGPSTLNISYSDVEGGCGDIYEQPGSTVTCGARVLNDNPLFETGPDGDYYLAQNAVINECVDSEGSDASAVCFESVDDTGTPMTVCMNELTTNKDITRDSGTVDMGYHYSSSATLAADLSCLPSSGVLPFSTVMTVTMDNLYTAFTRRFAAHIDVSLAGGPQFTNWKSGHTNVTAGASYVQSWSQTLPQLGSLLGDNVFTLIAEDVTPPPYNQLPYPPSGQTDTSGCTVTGFMP